MPIQKPKIKSLKTPKDSFVSAVNHLSLEIESLKNQKYLKITNNKSKLFTHHLFIGFAQGLGVVIGGTLGVSILLFILSKLSLFPIIGDFALKIVNIIKK